MSTGGLIHGHTLIYLYNLKRDNEEKIYIVELYHKNAICF